MKFIEFVQYDRQDWLNWRHAGIGSSDSAVVMGVSRFKKLEQLLEEKSGPVPPEDQSNTYIKERGNRIEFQVRAYLENTMNVTLAAMNCHHEAFPFIRASLDGATPNRKTLVEIKLLSSVNPDKVNTEAEGYKKWVAAKAGKVPDEYYPQIQHQLFVTGADECYFVGYKEVKGNQVVTEEKLAIVKVLPDKEYIKSMVQKQFEFWFNVQEMKKHMEYKGELE